MDIQISCFDVEFKYAILPKSCSETEKKIALSKCESQMPKPELSQLTTVLTYVKGAVSRDFLAFFYFMNSHLGP